jgi:hypothetical protein
MSVVKNIVVLRSEQDDVLEQFRVGGKISFSARTPNDYSNVSCSSGACVQ